MIHTKCCINLSDSSKQQLTKVHKVFLLVAIQAYKKEPMIELRRKKPRRIIEVAHMLVYSPNYFL